jgi:hypothetical protein
LETLLSHWNYLASKFPSLCLLYPFTFISVESSFGICGRHHLSSDLKLINLLRDFYFLNMLLINVDKVHQLLYLSWFIVVITPFIRWTWNTKYFLF